MFNSDHFEMKEQHRNLLTQHRLYLLHNLRPGEELWSSLMSKGVLTMEMVEEIKANGTRNQQVSAFLNVLPARGPSAFDEFCDTLLECDHAHVAEYIKTVEATDQFREDVKHHMEMSDIPNMMLEKFVTIFKKTTPAMQRFAERKFEVLMEEQESDMKEQETELEELTNRNTKLQLEVDQLRDVVKSFVEISRNISSEVRENIPSKHILNEEIIQLERLKKEVQDSSGNEQASEYYSNMTTIVRYIEQNTEAVIKHKNRIRREKSSIQLDRGGHMSLIDKVLNLSASISRYIEDISAYPDISSEVIGAELQKVCGYSQHMANDVTLIRNNFSHMHRQKKKTDGEILSLLHNFQEIRRLERELKERKNHITELNKNGQLIKKKMGKTHKKELEQIQTNLNQQKIQLDNVQKALESQINSADQRLRLMCELLPDHEETDSNCDTLSISCSSPGNDDMRPMSGTFPRQRMNGEPYLLPSPHLTPPATAVSMDTSEDIQTNPRSSRSVISVKKSVRTLEKSNNENKPMEVEPKAPSVSEVNGATKTQIKPKAVEVKKELIRDKTENKTDSPKKVGQAYNSKMNIPIDKPQRNVNTTGKLPTKPEQAPSQPTTKSTTSEESCEPSEIPKEPHEKVLVLKESRERLSNITIETAVKLPVKRHHESSSGSDSHPSSAESTSRKRPTEDDSLSKKPTETEKPPIKWDSSTKVLVTPDKTDANRLEDNKEVTRKVREEPVPQPRTRYQRMSTQTMTASRPPPTGMSREAFYQYIRNQQQGHTAEIPDRPLVIGRLHKTGGRYGHTGREIPSTQTIRSQPVIQPQSYQEPNDPTSNQSRKPGHRQALSTKRVEPAFKLPNQR